MSMGDDQARVSLVAEASATSCELCTAQTPRPSTTVVVHHPRGGTVRLAACDWCVQAIRRLSAATGGRVAFALSEAAGPPPASLPAVPRGTRPAGPPVLILELTHRVQDATGVQYVARVYGRERTDGTWEGWLEFVAIDAPVVRRTGQETTQSNRADLAYWASGLEPAYLEGAFARTQPERAGTPGSI